MDNMILVFRLLYAYKSGTDQAQFKLVHTNRNTFYCVLKKKLANENKSAISPKNT